MSTIEQRNLAELQEEFPEVRFVLDGNCFAYYAKTNEPIYTASIYHTSEFMRSAVEAWRKRAGIFPNLECQVNKFMPDSFTRYNMEILLRRIHRLEKIFNLGPIEGEITCCRGFLEELVPFLNPPQLATEEDDDE